MNISKWYQAVAASAVMAGTLVLASCSTAPRIHSIYEQDVDFRQYRTYAFFQKHQPQGEEYLSLQDKYLRQAIAQELQARGMREAEDPDVLVGFNVSSQEKIASTSYPSPTLGYYGYRTRYGYTHGLGYAAETRVRQYTEGTLNIDVVDREQKQLVWEGVAVGRLKDQPSANFKGEVSEVVSAVFEEYPVPEQGAR